MTKLRVPAGCTPTPDRAVSPAGYDGLPVAQGLGASHANPSPPQPVQPLPTQQIYANRFPRSPGYLSLLASLVTPPSPHATPRARDGARYEVRWGRSALAPPLWTGSMTSPRSRLPPQGRRRTARGCGMCGGSPAAHSLRVVFHFIHTTRTERPPSITALPHHHYYSACTPRPSASSPSASSPFPPRPALSRTRSARASSGTFALAGVRGGAGTND